MLVTLAPLASPLGNFRIRRARFLAAGTALFAALFVASSATAIPPTTTVLSTSSAAVSAGTPVTLTAVVQTASGAYLYNGQVAFCDTTAAGCTDIHRLFVAPLIAGTATYKFTPGPGVHTYNAVFLGINPYAVSASSALTVAVTPRRATVTSITPSGSPGAYALSSTVSAAGATPPTGTVSFLDTSNSNYVLGTAALVPGAPALGFTNSPTLSPGSYPFGVASGDFDGDGKQDLAILNVNSVAILLGNGNGTFSPHATLAGFTNPNAIVTGDFNNDGILDLAVINNGTTEVWVLLGTGGGNFGAPITTSVSNNPSALAVADFNNDGTPDLVVTSMGSNSVDVLTGNGYGNFSLTGLHAVGNHPDSVAVADFNNDGKQDIVVANYNDGTVTVLFGDGNGNIASSPAPVTIGAFGQSYSVVTADFNGDGNEDFAVADFFTSTVTIFLGTGNGTFITPPKSAGTGTNPIALAVADFNGDGIPDLVAVDADTPSGSVSILLGKGDGSFGGYLSAPVGSDPRSVAIGDFNGDGVADLVVPNYLDATATVLLAQSMQSATATANVSGPIGVGNHQVAASYPGDANFAASTSTTTGLMTYQITGQQFTLTANPASSVSGQPVTLTVSMSPYTAQNHSTDGEAVTFSTPPGGNVIGTGHFASGVATLTLSTLPAGTSDIQALYRGDADFASDVTNDLFYTVASVTSTTLRTGHTSAPAGTPITLTATVLSGTTPITTGLVAFCDAAAPHCTDIHRLGTAQLTSAGSASIVITPALGSHSYKAVFLGTTASASSSSPASSLIITGRAPTTTALTSGGAPGNYTLGAPVSSVTRTAVSGTVSFVDTTNGNAVLGSATLGASTSSFNLSPPHTFSTGTTPKAIATGDFNNDGLPDFVTAAYAGNTFTVELGNGDGTFTFAAPSPSTTLANPNAVTVGDFNGDGDQDLAIANYGNGTVSVFLGHGDGTFTELSAVYGTGLLPQALVAADFNNDGIPDLAIASAYNNTVSIFLGHGDGTFTAVAAPALGAGNYPAALVAADFNNDGNQDIAAANAVDGTITVFFGAGSGQFPSSYTIQGVGGSYGLATADLDGDGNADLIALNSGGNTVTVLRGNGTGAFTPLASPVTATNPIAVAVGDLNGDGIPDLVTGDNNPGNTLDLFLGNGDGTFQPAIPYATGAVPQALALADFNGDGFADPLTANSTASTAILLLAQPTQTATATANNISPTGAAGPHNIQANFPGDTTHAPSASNLVSLTPLPFAAVPAFSTAAGTYTSAQTVTLSTSTPNAIIFYTTDGSTPTTSSPQYTAPISVAASETIKAFASSTSYQASPVATAAYTINYPPVITAQPTASQTIAYGGTVTLSVTATSTTPLTYQWFSGNSPDTSNPIPGATAATYATSTLYNPGTQPATFHYWVQVNNASAVPANSATATVTVNARPFAATPTFSPPAGAYTSAQTVTLATSTPAPGGIYYTTDGSTPTNSSPQYTGPLPVTATETIRAIAAASGYQNSAIAAATYTINYPPAITNPPSSRTINSGSSATLTVSASGTAPLSYQWFSGPTASSLAPIAGANNASYTASSLTATTYFQVQVNNASATPASATATITVITPPIITNPPSSQTINSGGSATFTVSASGTAPLSYQWFSGPSPNTASPIPGATTSTFTTPTLTTTSSFWVQVNNASAQPANSTTATITVIAPPTITAQTPNPTINTGQSTTLGVTTTGTSLVYQWFSGLSPNPASPIPGATSATYTTPPLTTTSSFWVQASNSAATRNSATFLVTVIQAPVCTLAVQPTATLLTVVATVHCNDPQNQTLTSQTIAWGDGASSPVNVSSNTNTHTYTAAATYTVTASATDTSGITGSVTQRVSPNQSPLCTLGVVQGQFSKNPSLTQYPVTVSGGCTDPQGQPLTLSLDWGDGTAPLTAPPFIHAYNSATTVTFNVVLTATDASGLTGSSAPQPVQIVPAQPIPPGGSTPVASTIPPPPTPPAVATQVTFLCSSVSVQVNSQTVTTLPSAYGISCTSPAVSLTSSPTPVNVNIITSNGLAAAVRPPRATSTLALCGLAGPFLGLAFLLPLAPARRRRITALALACILCLSLSACGGYFQAPAVAATPSGLYYITLVETVVNPPAPTGFVQTSLIVPLRVTP